jgi:ketosteroid isomerase-like protein
MRNSRIAVVTLMWVFVSIAALPALAQSSNKQVADEIIAIVKAQWAAGNQKNTAESMKNVADEYTEFNGDYATRLDGKAISVRISEASDKGSGKNLLSEMVNEKVQVYGDVAILSYNFVGLGQDKDGKTEPNRAKSTRVYVKQGGKWMLVHANFGSDPLPK